MSTGVPNPKQTSMVGGHAQYVKGRVDEIIGNVTGSETWKETGKRDIKEGVEQMQTANATKPEPSASSFGGRVEEMAGKAVGCDGMAKQGKTRRDSA